MVYFYTQILMNVYLLVRTIALSSVTTHLAVSSAHVGQDMLDSDGRTCNGIKLKVFCHYYYNFCIFLLSQMTHCQQEK